MNDNPRKDRGTCKICENYSNELYDEICPPCNDQITAEWEAEAQMS